MTSEPRPTRWDWRPKLRWFAAEYLIVVLGVLTAVGINAGWGDREDRAREHRHLHQLAADLRETARLTAEVDAAQLGPDRAGGQIWAAFYAADPPPRDSLFAWRAELARVGRARPVLGTVEALVATGDLGLVRDDSLRTAIAAYLETARRQLDSQEEQRRIWWAGLDRLDRGLDLIEAYHQAWGQARVEAAVEGSPSYPPLGETRVRFPLDAEAFLSDRELLGAAWRMTRAKDELRSLRAAMRDDALALLRRIETHTES
ncbi:hypothetical protein [Rubrivirga sp. IMCC45206]|uniref:hypothetical protein n=1 Tax=Rubrivirga sp. IMCC45206 TaxID=3391614 RepID=UPI0039902C36